MITGNIKSQIDQIWNAFWSGGISYPLEVIEQFTYLLFLRRLDDLHTLEETRSARPGAPMTRRIFPAGNDGIGKNGGGDQSRLGTCQIQFAKAHYAFRTASSSFQQ